MTDIYNCRFLAMLQESGSGPFLQSEIESAYIEFRDLLVSISDGADSYTSKFRLLVDLQIRLHLLSISSASMRRLKKNVSVYFHLKLARRNIEAELELLDRRISNPELFALASSPPRSQLCWLHKPIDLSELLTYLNMDGAFGYVDGCRASFADVVRSFEYLLNVRLGDPRDVKRSVLQRKYKQVAYLKKLLEQNSK